MEVPAQLASAQSHVQTVPLQSEVVDADLGVSVPHEQLASRLEQIEPLFGRGQRVRRDHLLALGHPRHVRVAIQRHPIRRQRQQLLHRLVDPLFGLVRQAIQDVRVQGLDTPRTDHVDRLFGDIKALDPADRLLDLVVEVLDPDRRAIHPRCGQRIKAGLVDLVGINLDREFISLGERRNRSNGLRQIGHHGCRQQSRCAATPMQTRQSDALR